MFILDGKPLALNRAFTHDGVQYPANWLRLASPAERAAIGITEAPDPPTWDQRFYWGYDQDGKLIPKDHTQLVEQWVGQTKATAGSLLTPFDWYIVREAETGKAVPQEVLDYRAAVRVISDNREVMLKGTTTTEQLAAIIVGDFNGLFPWPSYPYAPAANDDAGTTSGDGVVFPGDGVTSGF